MRPQIAVAALPLALLAACGGSSPVATHSAAPAAKAASPIHRNGRYASVDQLRAAVRAAGIPCSDAQWHRVTPPRIPAETSEGWCGDTVRLATTKNDKKSPALVATGFSSDEMKKSISRSSKSEAVAAYIKGSNWVVQVDSEARMKQVIKHLGGQDALKPK